MSRQQHVEARGQERGAVPCEGRTPAQPSAKRCCARPGLGTTATGSTDAQGICSVVTPNLSLWNCASYQFNPWHRKTLVPNPALAHGSRTASGRTCVSTPGCSCPPAAVRPRCVCQNLSRGSKLFWLQKWALHCWLGHIDSTTCHLFASFLEHQRALYRKWGQNTHEFIYNVLVLPWKMGQQISITH